MRFIGDLRQGFRQLLHQPGFSAAAVGSLALGIGLTTALFCVVNAVLFRGSPVRQADRLVEIYSGFTDYPQLTNSYPDYVSVRERADAFAGVAAHSWVRTILTGSDRPRLVTGESVSANYFDVLGIAPVLGRGFTPEEERVPLAAAVVVVSHGLWQRQFGGRGDVIGKTLELSGRPYSVVGVAPRAMRGAVPGIPADFWVPVSMIDLFEFSGVGWTADNDPGATRLEQRGSRWLFVKGRLAEGRTVRLTGQDTRRGTFVQRFAAVVDRASGESWVPLKHLDENQGKFHVFDSLLSEFAAMGFEYGYSVARPEALVLWEAQFGDFANGAQTIIDEFISSGQAKWTQKSGVVLLLPHGYEGQGPDHSSGRIERWLQLGAEDAFTVAQPSTPASHFHLLRQQALWQMHRPLIIFTPKSMLRNRMAVSMPSDFTTGSWRPVLPDPTIEDASKVTSVILCTGKVRWDLVNRRGQAGKAAWPSFRSSGSIPCPPSSWPINLRPSTRSMRFVGCRMSRPTRAPGRSWH